MYDGGDLLRRLCFILSEKSCTPITFWLDLPLCELVAWVETNNEILRGKLDALKRR